MAMDIEADNKKAHHIMNWLIPKSATEARSFLGLIRYLADFLPALAEYTTILTELTMKSNSLGGQIATKLPYML